jgi:hypothetical protein
LNARALHPQVGAPDPDKNTSPIVGEDDDAEVEPNVAGGGCTFDDAERGLGRVCRRRKRTISRRR